MSNIMEYKELMAFHPGYFIAEIIEDMGITQEEFATRMGTTGKTLSQLISGITDLSDDLAKKISAMLGTDVEFWLNLQKIYDAKVIEFEKMKDFEAQKEFLTMIDYSYFVRLVNLPKTTNAAEKIANLCKFFTISDLRILAQDDFLVNYRSGISNVELKNIVNARAWMQTALNFAKNINTEKFDAKKLKEYLPEIRSMTKKSPEEFTPRLQEIFSKCGVAFVILPALKNSGINGAVKWINSERVVLAMNDRRTYADTFWFSLFHEICHVMQQKTKTVFVAYEMKIMKEYDNALENDANNFAQRYLVPEKEYRKFVENKYFSNEDIVMFANAIGIHPGIVVGRLQHDGIIPITRCTNLKQKYKVVIE